MTTRSQFLSFGDYFIPHDNISLIQYSLVEANLQQQLFSVTVYLKEPIKKDRRNVIKEVTTTLKRDDFNRFVKSLIY